MALFQITRRNPLAILLCTFVMAISGHALPCLAQSEDAFLQPRVWTSKSGATVKARFLRLDNGEVFLQQQPNHEGSIKLSDLSEDDQLLIANYWLMKGYSLDAFQEKPKEKLPTKPIRDLEGKLYLGHGEIYSGWNYATVTNATFSSRRVKTDLAVLASNNEVPLAKKKNAPTRLMLALGDTPNVPPAVFVYFTSGPVSKAQLYVHLSFDGKPSHLIKCETVPKIDALFLSDSRKIIAELKKSKTLVIELDVPDDLGLRHQFSFNTFGLKWKH